jgi:hypothetical protein
VRNVPGFVFRSVCRLRSRLVYSRLLVPRRGGDDAVVGLLSLHEPLGFETSGKDLVAFFRGGGEARRAAGRAHARARSATS